MYNQNQNFDEFNSDEFEFESLFNEESENEFESSDDQETFHDGEEMEMATDLLAVSNEEELEQFLGKLMKKFGKFTKSPAGKMLGGMLKKIAKKALPIAGTALGGFIGGPVGGKIGGQLGNLAGKAFGLELEGLSPEDQEFETAKGFVKFASEAAKKLNTIPANVSPATAAKTAIVSAAKKYAPGLIRNGCSPKSGRWVRKGGRIIIYGA